MEVNKSKYLTNTSYYIFIPLIKNFFVFFTLPVFTRFLSPGDYGRIGIITMITSFSSIFFLGLNNACNRYYFKYRDSNVQLNAMFSTTMLYVTGAALLYAIGLLFAFPLLNKFFFNGQMHFVWVLLAFTQYSLLYVNMINQNILQNQHEGRKWFFHEIIFIIVQVPLSIILVITKLFTFESIIIASLVAEFVKSIFIFWRLRTYYSPRFRMSFFKESFFYSWPLIPTTLIVFLYTYFDRIVLSRFPSGLSQIGLLDISTKLAAIIKTAQDGVSGTLSPFTLDCLTKNTEESYKKLAETDLKIVFGFLFLSLAVILFSKEIIMLLTTKDYYFVIYVAPLYIYYHIFGVLGLISLWFINYHPTKTYLQIPLNILALTASIIANILLIPKYGVMGAAFASFMTGAIVQTVQFYIGIRLTPIPISMSKIVLLFFVVILETMLLYLLYYFHLAMPVEILIKIFMLGIFFLSGLLAKITDLAEIKDLFFLFLTLIRNRVIFLTNTK